MELADSMTNGPPQPGTTFGPYVLGEQLGEGGMGRVFRATREDGAEVALKIVKSELARDSNFRRRFAREAGAARRVDHPRVVPVVDEGEVEGIPYLAQVFLSGGSLADRIDEKGPLPLADLVRVCVDAAKGLDAIHDVGLVHRDVKPDNILVDAEGRASIADLGLVKDRDASVLTRPGTAVGSWHYMAPEQIRGEEVTAPTDVYSLACVIFECLAGDPPFIHKRGMQLMWAHLQDEPPDPVAGRPDVPADVGWAVRRGLEKEPDKRPPTAMAFAHMVKAAAGIT